MKYTKIEDPKGSCVVRINDDETVTAIPLDPANSDYQAYLAWLAEEEKKETD
jgi:hypothetical protein